MIHRSNRTAFFFLAPNLAGFLLFIALPVVVALGLSFFRWDVFHEAKFIGFRHFLQMFGGATEDGEWTWNDPKFWQALGNTFFFLLAIPVSMAASLLLAVVLNQKMRGRLFFRAVFFLPTVCAGVGILLLWKLMMYNPQFGLINLLLAKVGIEGPKWLQDYTWAKPAIMNMMVWGSMGGTNMILYLAGLQGIAPELYEAAQIDGAGRWDQFRHITWPMLAPTTFFISTTSLISAFAGECDAVYVMTRGGPDGATTTLGYYAYRHAFEWFNMGYACSIAMVMFVLILTVTVIHWRYSEARSHYA